MFIQNYFYGAHWATVGVAPIPPRGSLLPLLATELQGRKHLLVTAHLENPQTNKQASQPVSQRSCSLSNHLPYSGGGDDDRQLEGIQSFDRLIDKSPGILSLLMNLMNTRINHRLKSHKCRMVVVLINRL